MTTVLTYHLPPTHVEPERDIFDITTASEMPTGKGRASLQNASQETMHSQFDGSDNLTAKMTAAPTVPVLFTWPYDQPKHVILTGTFDNWSGSVELDKVYRLESDAIGAWSVVDSSSPPSYGPSTIFSFQKTLSLPPNCDIKYKFLVDGNWCYDMEREISRDSNGEINNRLITPDLPLSNSRSMNQADIDEPIETNESNYPLKHDMILFFGNKSLKNLEMTKAPPNTPTEANTAIENEIYLKNVIPVESPISPISVNNAPTHLHENLAAAELSTKGESHIGNNVLAYLPIPDMEPFDLGVAQAAEANFITDVAQESNTAVDQSDLAETHAQVADEPKSEDGELHSNEVSYQVLDSVVHDEDDEESMPLLAELNQELHNDAEYGATDNEASFADISLTHDNELEPECKVVDSRPTYEDISSTIANIDLESSETQANSIGNSGYVASIVSETEEKLLRQEDPPLLPLPQPTSVPESPRQRPASMNNLADSSIAQPAVVSHRISTETHPETTDVAQVADAEPVDLTGTPDSASASDTESDAVEQTPFEAEALPLTSMETMETKDSVASTSPSANSADEDAETADFDPQSGELTRVIPFLGTLASFCYFL